VYTRHRDRAKEYGRNIFLILLAVVMVVIFFNLDMIREGDSVFSKSADKKLKFTGRLEEKNFSEKEVGRVLGFVKRYDDQIDSLVIRTSAQDSYTKISGNTELLFEITMVMNNGSTISTPVRRARRKALVSEVMQKLNKDMRAYQRLKKQGKKVDSLVNTM
jgi:hypothetical protein